MSSSSNKDGSGRGTAVHSSLTDNDTSKAHGDHQEQVLTSLSSSSTGTGNSFRAGLKSIFTRSPKDAKGSKDHQGLNDHQIDPYASESGPSGWHTSENRLSPSSKAYAILGEMPATPYNGHARPAGSDDESEIARAGWTTYRQRITSAPVHSLQPTLTQRSTSSTPISHGNHLDQSKACLSDKEESFNDRMMDSHHQKLDTEPSPVSKTSSWTSAASYADDWSFHSSSSRSTLTPDVDGGEGNQDASPQARERRIEGPVLGSRVAISPQLRPRAVPNVDHRPSFYTSRSARPITATASSEESDEARAKTPVPDNSNKPVRPARAEGRPRGAVSPETKQLTSATQSHTSAQRLAPEKLLPPVKTETAAGEDSAVDHASESGEFPMSSPTERRNLHSTNERISAPTTSPLLASLLAQQQQQKAASSSAPTSRAVVADRSRLAHTDGKVGDLQSQSEPLRAASTDAGANGKEERTSRSVITAPPPSKLTNRAQGDDIQAKLYVPPDALKRTRKGTLVQPTASPNNGQGEATSRAIPTPPSTGLDAQGSDGQATRFDSDAFNEENSVDAVNLLPASAWAEIESALDRFKALPMQGASEKGALLRTLLLPFLALEAETPNVDVIGPGRFQDGKVRRQLFFQWIRTLLLELQSIQTSADRGAILESIACIIESRNFSGLVIASDPDDQQAFYAALSHIISYAIGELNKKGVYQNTLIFSGRLLAVAFFRIDGVASKLLRSLPVNRFALERVAAEVAWHMNARKDFESFRCRFPLGLQDYCFEDARSYLKTLDAQSGQSEDEDRYLVRQSGVEVEMSGNWLRRWQSDDSELFFSFCRSYHRQLASLMASLRGLSSPTASDQRVFFGGPGYAHLATCVHQKCLSLVHRDILSVTTLSSQKNFNPGETANVLSGSTAGKPRHLEAANRRCTAIVVDIIRSTPAAMSGGSIFAPMLGIHVKCLVKRTSLYDVQGVFCLLDWLDGVLTHMETAEMTVSTYIDVPFLLDTIRVLFKDADHALALMRTIAFCYSNFAVLTSTSDHRMRFLEDVLLSPSIFHKLFLSWSFTIRAYFLHLLVFRLARITDFETPEDDPKGKASIRIIKLFNQRLDEIRQRHDELSPQPSVTGSQTDDYEDQTKRRPSSFVSTIKRTPSMHKEDTSPTSATKAERILGIGAPDPALAGPGSLRGENKAQSRAAKWLRVLGGNKGGKLQRRLDGSPAQLQIGSPLVGLSDTSSEGLPGNASHTYSEQEVDPLQSSDLGLESGINAKVGSTRSKKEGKSEDDEVNSLRRALEGYELDASFKRDGERTATSGQGSAESNTTLKAMSPTNDPTAPPGEHLSKDVSFDLQNAPAMLPPLGFSGAEAGAFIDGNTSWAAPHSPQRVSRAFSRRRSMLPGPAMDLVAHAVDDESGSHHDVEESDAKGADAGADSPSIGHEDGALGLLGSNGAASKRSTDAILTSRSGVAYDRNLHIYAVQSLREYEQTVQEHDDFFNSQPQDGGTPQVPRLPIQWPAMWSE